MLQTLDGSLFLFEKVCMGLYIRLVTCLKHPPGDMKNGGILRQIL